MIKFKSNVAGKCTVKSLVDNVRQWLKNGFKVIFASVESSPTSGRWTVDAIVTAIKNGARFVLSNVKLNAVVSLSNEPRDKLLPFHYTYSCVTCSQQGLPVIANAFL